MTAVPYREANWACDCKVGNGNCDALVHDQGCASQVRKAEQAKLVQDQAPRCQGCDKPAEGRDPLGRRWCSPCWQIQNARAHAWWHPAESEQPAAESMPGKEERKLARNVQRREQRREKRRDGGKA